MVGEVIGYAAVIFLLAFLTESMVEYAIGTPMDKVEKLKPFRWTLIYASAGVGVGLAFYYALDFVHLLGVVVNLDIPTGWPGTALTGLSIGRGANYVHDLVTRYIKKPEFPFD